MCAGPELAVAGGVMQAAQSGFDIASAFSRQSDQVEAYRDFRRRVKAGVAFQGSVVRSRTLQERAQIAEEITSLTADAIRLTGQTAAALGESEGAGRTVADVQLDTARAKATSISRLNILQQFREASAEQELRSLVISSRNQLLGAVPQFAPIPGLLGEALKAGEAAMAGLEIGNALNPEEN